MSLLRTATAISRSYRSGKAGYVMDYTGFLNQVGSLMSLTTASPAGVPTDSYFTAILPGCIAYAELRIYRDLDIQLTRQQATVTVASGAITVSLPANAVVVEALSLVSGPNSAAIPVGVPTLLYQVDKNYLEAVYPPAYAGAQGAPVCYYVLGDSSLLLGPFADQEYTLQVLFEGRPAPLSADNTTTILTEKWPDLFVAAAMVFMSGYQKNFGAQADDPKMAMSWETQYQALLRGAMDEEARKKGEGAGYNPLRGVPGAGAKGA